MLVTAAIFTCLYCEKGGMVRVKCLVIGFHLLVLFLGSLPSPAKSADEKLAPVGSPSPSESPTSTYNVSVQGNVFCKCKLPGYASKRTTIPRPRIQVQDSRLPGAGVHLKCGSQLVSEGKTDDDGGFALKAQFPQLANWEAMNRFVEKRCKVYVASTPVPACTVPESLGPAGGVDLTYDNGREVGPGYIASFHADLLDVGPDGCDKE